MNPAAPTVCIFCIGTGHNSSEDALVLVKLWQSCRLTDLGVEGNHTSDGPVGSVAHGVGSLLQPVTAHVPGLKDKRLVDAEVKRIQIDQRQQSVNGGWKWINEGQNSHGGGFHQQLLANVKLIRDLKNPAPRRVVLMGHSRGAVLCIGIATELERQMQGAGQSAPECHLFLYDPVKRLKATSDSKYDLHVLPKCVVRTRIVVMEDEGRDIKFPLLEVNAKAEDYLRLPGTHGTATQVTGHPIGKLGFMLALEWLTQIGVPVSGGHKLGDRNFCDQYELIQEINPVKYGIRRVNDAGKRVTHAAKPGYGDQTVGARDSVLDRLTGPRDDSRLGARGTSRSFVNEDHLRRFKRHQSPA